MTDHAPAHVYTGVGGPRGLLLFMYRRFTPAFALRSLGPIAASLTLETTSPCHAQANLIYNGGFEIGYTAWQGASFLGATNNGYVLKPGPVEGRYIGLIWDAQEGLRQSFPTTLGNTYRIEFAMRLPELVGGAPYSGNSVIGPSLLTLEIDHQPLAQQVIENRDEWRTYSFDFTATQTRSEMELSIPHSFQWNGRVQETESLFIDNVRVTAVPEPRAAVLMLLSAPLIWNILGRPSPRRR